jgi:hypothetical protein
MEMTVLKSVQPFLNGHFMNKNYFAFYSSNALLGLLIVGSAIVGWLVETFCPAINAYLGINFLQYPSTTVIMGGLMKVIDKFWNVWPFKHLFWAEDIAARYEGSIRYLDFDSVTMPFVIEVKQSASQISMCCFYTNYRSEATSCSSKVENLVKEFNGKYSVTFTFTNESHDDPAEHYHGTISLEIKESNTNGERKIVLEGDYYNNRRKCSNAKIKCSFVSKELKNEA